MKELERPLNYRHSFFRQFFVRFIYMIIVPILGSWWIYVKLLNFYYADNTLSTQQINMENSISWLKSSLNATSNVFTALGGNSEVIYYLEYYSDKPSMLYSLIKNIYSFCNNLYAMTPYLSSLKIYSDDPMLLYADPFAKLEEIPLDLDLLNILENSHPQEILWRVNVSEGETFPAICGYQKLYMANYAQCIGFAEVQLSADFLLDYFRLLSDLSDDPDAVFTFYLGDTVIYTSSPDGGGMLSPEALVSLEPGYEIKLFRNQYRNVLEIPMLDLRVIRSGRFTDLLKGPSDKLPSVLISLIISLLLVLFVGFFFHVALLSRRILVFSSFIRHSDPDNLVPFRPEREKERMDDELDSLVDAYNTMIHENNALISQVQKMELLSQNAKYQALQGQIHPHFIYGTLETIRMMALQNRDKETADMIFSLSSLMRYSISISSRPVTLRDELEIASHYLQIQKVRFDDRMDYAFNIDESLLGLELPSFLLQPILENAIVYGISQTLEHCALNVDAYSDDSDITLSVSNSGLPIAGERLLEINRLLSGDVPLESFQGGHNGLALNNIKERLAIFFHGHASVRLALRDCRTATIIVIQKSALH